MRIVSVEFFFSVRVFVCSCLGHSMKHKRHIHLNCCNEHSVLYTQWINGRMDFCLPSSPSPFDNIYASMFYYIVARQLFFSLYCMLTRECLCVSIVSNISEKQILLLYCMQCTNVTAWKTRQHTVFFLVLNLHLLPKSVFIHIQLCWCSFFSHTLIKIFHSFFYCCIIVVSITTAAVAGAVSLLLLHSRANNKFKLQLQLKMKRTWRKLRTEVKTNRKTLNRCG